MFPMNNIFLGDLLRGSKSIDNDDMRFWYLRPMGDDTPWPDGGVPTSALVVARNEDEAREIAAEKSDPIWLDKYNAECEEITPDEFNEPEMIIDSYPLVFGDTPCT